MTISEPAISSQPQSPSLSVRRGFDINTVEMQAWRERVGAAQTSARQYVTSPSDLSPDVRPPLVRDKSSAVRPTLVRNRRISELSQASNSSRHSPRPSLFRASISQQMMDAPIPSPQVGVGLDPARTDYFEQASSSRTSLRPLAYLATVMAGRVLLSLGLGGISVGFHMPQNTAPGLVRTAPPRGTFGSGNRTVFALGVTATITGALLAAMGLTMFLLDTYALNPRRAVMMAAIGLTGVAGVASGGVVYLYGQNTGSQLAVDLSLLPRTVGNFGVFYALPNSFATTEIVHGNAPIPHREQTRQIAFALGGAVLILYGYITSPGIDAPQFAREICLSLGIVGICVGASMARTNNLRLASERRQLRSPAPERRHSSLLREIPMRNV